MNNNVELGRCPNCDLVGMMAVFVGGWREGVLAKMIEEYKYQSVWALGDVLAEVLDTALPMAEDEVWYGTSAEDVVVVPLPTIGQHVRKRGLDHTLKMARKLAKRRKWDCVQALVRAADTVQVGTKAADREMQARKAYRIGGKIDAGKTYILLDDVWTTGASMRGAVEVMRKAGAERVIGLVVAVGRPQEGD